MLNQFNSTYIGRKLKVLLAQSDLERHKFSLYDIGVSTAELMGLLKERDYWQQEYYRQLNSQNIDLLLTPTMPFTAP